MNTPSQSRIFISYSHRGNGLAWKDRLLTQLAVFEKHHVLNPWHDDETKLGDDWHARINAAMGSARLAVLLLTNEFLKSPFVLQHELPELQRRHKEEGLIIAPILCERSDWEANPWLASLQIKPREQATPVPLTSLSHANRDHVLRQLATEIAVELGGIALAELSLLRVPHSEGDVRHYLDKFPLTRSPGLREEKLIGREQELALLDLAFAQPHTAIVSLVAWGGVGKTMLVQHWLQHLQRENWFGTRRIYAWSFYSQGTKEDRQASEDTFLAHALEWFGVKCEPKLSPWDKGRLLADAVAHERTLLILDGIEPLQYPPGPMGGQLRAPGVQSLLKQLARKANAANSEIGNALCLVTTREPLTDLADFQRREGSPWGSVLRVDLGNLTDEAGAALLHHAGASRAGAAEIKPDDKELLAASREVDGHAITLNLLGRFLARAHGGDIRRRDLVKFEEADRAVQGGTTFKMLAAFENWFAKSGEIGARQLVILRILGLFDRPADAGCVGELRKTPAIAGLTEPLFLMTTHQNFGLAIERCLPEEDWKMAVSFLSDFGLIINQVDGQSNGCQIDCHPLIRDYFAEKLSRNDRQAWRAANTRLYQFLAQSTPTRPPAGLSDLVPLYRAIGYGCAAGQYHQAFLEIFWQRIVCGEAHYREHTFFAFGEQLATIAKFFDQCWDSPVAELPAEIKGWLMNQAAICLRALGRSLEAVQCMRASVALIIPKADLKNAVIGLGNLSQLDLTVGQIAEAVSDARKAVQFADHGGDCYERMVRRTILADALFQSGLKSEAEDLFAEAQGMQAREQPEYPLLYSQRGYKYNELLLHEVEKSAWRKVFFCVSTLNLSHTLALTDRMAEVEVVQERIQKTLQWAIGEQATQAIGLDYLIVAQTLLFATLIKSTKQIQTETEEFEGAKEHILTALNALNTANENEFIIRALLTRSWISQVGGNTAVARADLDEAWDIAERGPMRLHIAEIHLYRARLFFREKEYPWRIGKNLNGEWVTNRTAVDDLAAAEKLINDCGYHRRDEELADARRAILGTT